MDTTEITLRKNIKSLLLNMDIDLLQHLSDYAAGLIEYTKNGHDWWDDLTENDKAEIEEGIKEIEAGNYFTKEETFARYKHILND